MEFPRYVFTSPGNLSAGWGKTYGQEIVNDESEYDAAIAAGWFGTRPEALDAVNKPKIEEAKKAEPVIEEAQEEAGDDGLADLVSKAEALGIKVDKRWKTARLSEEIAKAEEAKDAVRE